MSSSLRIIVAGMIVVAFGVKTIHAQDEKPNKEKPASVNKDGEKPTKEQPAKEKPEAVKKDGEKPTKEQPAKEKPEAVKKNGEKPTKEQPAKEKPETVKKQPEKPKEQPATEKKPEKRDTPVEKKPEALKKGNKPQAKAAAKQGTVVEAVVKSVDTSKNSITVILRKNEDKVDQTFTVEKDARFLVGGDKSASLADMKPDTRVALILTEQKTVAGIKAAAKGDEGKKAQSGGQGIVKAVDVEKNEITLAIKEGVDQSFAVAKDARIFIPDGEGKISELKPGMWAGFALSKDKKTILVIKAAPAGEKGPQKKKEGEPKK